MKYAEKERRSLYIIGWLLPGIAAVCLLLSKVPGVDLGRLALPCIFHSVTGLRGNQGAAAAFAWRYPAIFVLSSIGALRCGALWVVYGFQQCGIFEQRKIQNRNALP